MFEKIDFTTTTSSGRLTSRGLTSRGPGELDVNKEAVANTNFSISGSVDAFQKPPIAEFAKQNLFYMQDFDIFHYEYGSFTERRNYSSFLLLYTYSGNGTLSYQDHSYSLESGDGFFINCMDYHMYKVEGNHWDTGVLHIKGPLLHDFHNLYMQSGGPLFHEEVNGQYQKYLERLLYLYQVPQLHRDWQVSTCIDNLLNHVLNLCANNTAAHTQLPDNIRYLVKYMEHNYNQPLSLSYLAEFSNMSKYYLSREFKKYTGFSPNDYLISLRINQAKVLLKSSDLPAAKIAHEVGIHDLNNFTNLFKKKVGKTPIQYRKSTDFFS